MVNAASCAHPLLFEELSCQICCRIAVNAPLTHNPALILKTDIFVMCDANLMRCCSFLQVLTVEDGALSGLALMDVQLVNIQASPKTCSSFGIETKKSTLPNR